MSAGLSPETRHRIEADLIDAAKKSPAVLEAVEGVLRARASMPAPAIAQPQPAVERAASVAFSFIFFAGSSGRNAAEKYDLLHDLARFGDAHGFEAVWIPERHFHPFGGIYSSPVVMAASLAKLTRQIRLRAGSVVLPLHHPVTVTESWAIVDQLSGGRVDLGFASGWNPNDFVTAPEVFPRLREVWLERIGMVQRLWRGDEVSLPNGKGEPCPIAIFPRPVQPELNVWLTVTSRDDSFIEAGRRGFNVLTMLKGISVEELGRKIALYRHARAAAGFDRAAGIVTLMLHTLVHADREWVRTRTAESFGDYIKAGLSGHVQAVGAGERPDDAATQKIVEYAAERYSQRAALFGTPEDCRSMVDAVQAVGVNEVALLMDFGVDAESVKASLPHLLTLTQSYETPRSRAARRAPPPPMPRTREPIAVVGMSGCFPGSPDVDAFWAHLRDGDELISDIPAHRWDAGPALDVRRAGLLDDLDRFDAASFRITNREASSMDPHQRFFLDAAARAIADAGYQPEALAGSRTGVFVAAYNADFTVRAATGRVPLDAYTSTGTSLFMVANRVSHVFDLRGPSEVVNTACSSALVALHRAVQALRNGECELAIAGGVSLLLSMGRLAGLDQYGIISKEGRVRPFDRHTTGQVIGEGAGAFVLKTLSAAERDGDTILGLIRGSAVNHHGNRSGSPTLPDVHAQADVILDACRDGGVTFDEIDYIEAHGTGGFGDIVELEAFKRADALTRADGGVSRGPASCGIGTLKPNIGFLEAAGGVSQAAKLLLMLRHETIAPTLNHTSCPDDVDLEKTPFSIVTRARAWTARLDADGRPLPRRASAHAYGLGGTNAHVVFEEYPQSKAHARRPAAVASADAPHARSVAAPGPLVRDLRVTPESPIVADHRVRGRGVVPAVAYLELAADTCRPHLAGGAWRFENVFWLAPCVVDAAEKTLRCTAKPLSSGGLFFEIVEQRGGELLATGHVHAGRSTLAHVPERLDPESAARDTTGALTAREIYDAPTAPPVQHGAAFRAIEQARVGATVVVSTLKRPSGESPDALVSRGLLEGAMQSARHFSGRGSASGVFMPFSVDAIEIHAGAIPDRCLAVVRPRVDGGDDTDAGRFDAAIVADGRPWAVMTNVCARRERSDAVDVERVLIDLAAGRVTVAEAERLLGGFADDTWLRETGEIFVRAGQLADAGDLRSRSHGDATIDLLLPGGTVRLSREDLTGLVDGRIDPTVLALQGRVTFDPPNELFAREVGDAFFRHYNVSNIARSPVGGVLNEIYRSGVVTAASGERRTIYPWAIPAAAGLALGRLVRTRKCSRTLEIGMAYGLATLFVCEAHCEAAGGRHTAIDPHQRLDFLGIGLRNVERAGLSAFLEFIEAEDALALPELERRGDRFDLVFIDGLHMFDYALLDFFYADRLLRAGGCIVFDDAHAPGVRRAIDFVKQNRAYRVLDGGLDRLAVLEKREDDTRSLVNPNHFRDF